MVTNLPKISRVFSTPVFVRAADVATSAWFRRGVLCGDGIENIQEMIDKIAYTGSESHGGIFERTHGAQGYLAH